MGNSALGSALEMLPCPEIHAGSWLGPERASHPRVSCRLPSRHVAEYPPVDVQVPCTVRLEAHSFPLGGMRKFRDQRWRVVVRASHAAPRTSGASIGAERGSLIGRTVEKLRCPREIGQASDTNRQSLGGYCNKTSQQKSMYSILVMILVQQHGCNHQNRIEHQEQSGAGGFDCQSCSSFFRTCDVNNRTWDRKRRVLGRRDPH